MSAITLNLEPAITDAIAELLKEQLVQYEAWKPMLTPAQKAEALRIAKTDHKAANNYLASLQRRPYKPTRSDIYRDVLLRGIIAIAEQKAKPQEKPKAAPRVALQKPHTLLSIAQRKDASKLKASKRIKRKPSARQQMAERIDAMAGLPLAPAKPQVNTRPLPPAKPQSAWHKAMNGNNK